MNIRIEDKWLITSDKLNYILNEIKIIGVNDSFFKPNEENIGKEKYIPIGYFVEFDKLIEFISNLKIKESTANNLSELMKDIKTINKWVQEQLKSY